MVDGSDPPPDPPAGLRQWRRRSLSAPGPPAGTPGHGSFPGVLPRHPGGLLVQRLLRPAHLLRPLLARRAGSLGLWTPRDHDGAEWGRGIDVPRPPGICPVGPRRPVRVDRRAGSDGPRPDAAGHVRPGAPPRAALDLRCARRSAPGDLPGGRRRQAAAKDICPQARCEGPRPSQGSSEAVAALNARRSGSCLTRLQGVRLKPDEISAWPWPDLVPSQAKAGPAFRPGSCESKEGSTVQAVLLAGGKGTRLRPYTHVLPKPLMPLGEADPMPIIEVVLRQLARFGFREVTIITGYLTELIEA